MKEKLERIREVVWTAAQQLSPSARPQSLINAIKELDDLIAELQKPEAA